MVFVRAGSRSVCLAAAAAAQSGRALYRPWRCNTTTRCGCRRRSTLDMATKGAGRCCILTAIRLIAPDRTASRPASTTPGECVETKGPPVWFGVAIISYRYVKNAMVCQDRLGTNKRNRKTRHRNIGAHFTHPPIYYAMYTLMILCRMTGWNYMTADVPTALPLGCQRNCPYPPDPHRGP